MNNNVFDINLNLQDKNFVIWGGGRVGINIYEHLKTKGLHPIAFVDKNTILEGGATYDGIEYISSIMLDELAKERKIDVIIGSDRQTIIDEITDLLSQKEGIGNVYDISNIAGLLYQYEDRSHYIQHKVLGVQIHLAEHCNLNCKGCDHFSPLAKEEFLEVSQFEKDLRRLKEIFGDSLAGLCLLGGEPLLNKDIISIIEKARLIAANSTIKIVSNGVLLGLKEDDFWLACRDNNIILELTKYPINIDYDSLEEKAKNFGVKYQYSNIEPVKTLWKAPLDLEGKQDPEKMFGYCGEANFCISLDRGKLYTCSVAAWIRHFEEKFNVKFSYTEPHGIDIYGDVTKEDIFAHLAKPDGLCRYCKVLSRTYNNPWDQSKKDISEWT